MTGVGVGLTAAWTIIARHANADKREGGRGGGEGQVQQNHTVHVLQGGPGPQLEEGNDNYGEK